MYVLYAVSPLLLILIMLLGFRRGAVETSIAGLVVAIGVAVFSFGFSWENVGTSFVSGLDPALRVVYVLISGLWLYQLLKRTDALERIAGTVDGVSDNPLRRALFVVVVIAPFLEAVSGFGAGIVLAGPLILALGYTGMQAALLALLTQCAVPWGAMAVGTALGAEIAGVDLVRMGILNVYFAVPIFIYWCFSVAITVVSWKQAVRQSGDVLTVAGLMLVGLYLANRFVSVESACVLAGLGTAAILSLVWRNKKRDGTVPKEDRVLLAKAFLPYAAFLVLIAITHVLTVSPQFADWFKRHPYFYSPGTAMIVTCFLAAIVVRLKQPEIASSIRDTWKQGRPAVLSTIAFVVMGTMMKDAHMIEHVTQSLGNAGTLFAFAAPLLGGLGGWMTGSNAASNAMWMHFQAGMARTVGFPVDLTAAVQNTSAANLTMASPSRVALGAAIAGVSGKEGELLKRVGLLGLGVLAIVAVCGYLLLSFQRTD